MVAVKLPFSSALMYAQMPALLPSTPASLGSTFAEIAPFVQLDGDNGALTVQSLEAFTAEGQLLAVPSLGK